MKRFVNLSVFVCFFVLFCFLQLGISYLYIHDSFVKTIETSLVSLNDRVHLDLQFKNGTWDISRYNSDPYTAYPNTSSPFPLYVVTTDGFVIERSHPITSLLDTSDFNQLLKDQTPRSIKTTTNEEWRVYAKPIARDGKTYGVVAVSFYAPAPEMIEQIDQQLRDNADRIDEQLQIQHNEIDTSKLDIRNTHYNISFEIVSNFNKVLANEGRTPTFIDKSYVKNELNSLGTRIVQDSSSHEEFLVYSQPFLDQTNTPVGVVVVGKSLSSITTVLKQFLFFMAMLDLFGFLPVFAVIFYVWLRKSSSAQAALIAQAQAQPQSDPSELSYIPKSMSFDKKRSILKIDETTIPIPYASNQYELCVAVFSDPQKNWEADELLEQFGENPTKEAVRKVYDAMLAVNKKAGLKLIVYLDKRYSIHPKLVAAIAISANSQA